MDAGLAQAPALPQNREKRPQDDKNVEQSSVERPSLEARRAETHTAAVWGSGQPLDYWDCRLQSSLDLDEEDEAFAGCAAFHLNPKFSSAQIRQQPPGHSGACLESQAHRK